MKESKFYKKVVSDNIIDKERIRQNVLNQSASYKKPKFTAKKIFAIAAVVLLVIVASFATLSSIYYTPKVRPSEMKTTKNYKQIVSVIDDFRAKENPFRLDLPSFKATSPAPGAPISESLNNDYSKTNVQTKGMDEGDIVKTDGAYIYKLSTQGMFIISTNNGQMAVESSIVIDNYVPKELYVSEDYIILVGGVYYYEPSNYYGQIEPLADVFSYMSYSKTDIRVYNIQNKKSPELKRQLVIDGNFETSRLNEATGEFLYMVNYNFYYGKEETYIPKISDSEVEDGKEMQIPAENIFYYDDVVSYNYLVVGKIDINSADTISAYAAYLGLGGLKYVSNENIYVATYDYQSNQKVNIFGWVSSSSSFVTQTRIVKINFSSLKPTAAAKIEGTIKDRYSIDEYDGYLRVAATTRSNGSFSRVYVLASDLSLSGLIDNIAPGERIYSVRFNGTTGSLVTFRQVDPYFNLDLSDPKNPKISKGLKEDGVSHYIHYIGDTSYTIGVGRMSEEQGQGVRWTGLKVSLYDNSSGEAVNISTHIIYGSCHSELFYNPKALMYNEERGLFAFTYENWTYSYNSYQYNTMTQGLAVFSFDLTKDGADKLEYNTTLSNFNNGIDVYNNYYKNYRSYITRGIQIGNYVYTISDKYIKAYDITNLELHFKLDLD